MSSEASSSERSSSERSSSGDDQYYDEEEERSESEASEEEDYVSSSSSEGVTQYQLARRSSLTLDGHHTASDEDEAPEQSPPRTSPPESSIRSTAKEKLSVNSIKRLALGINFGLAIATYDEKTQAFSWGVNNNNILSLGEDVDGATLPQLIRDLEGKPLFDISVGVAHAAVVSKSADQSGGKVYTWGLGTHGRLGYVHDTNEGIPPDPKTEEPWFTLKPYRVRFGANVKVVRVSCGSTFTTFLSQHGEVYVCGYSEAGALGLGEDISCVWEPRYVPVLTHKAGEHGRQVLSEEYVTMVAAGVDHVVVCCRSGKTYSWGDGRNGRLGHGDDEPRSEPTLVVSLASETIVFVAAGSSHSAAIDRSERLWVWGSGAGGKLGVEDTIDQHSPVIVSSLQRIRAVHLGVTHSLAVDHTNKLYVWGSGPVVSRSTTVPVCIKTTHPVVVATSGLVSAMFVDDRGDMYGWGRAPLGLFDAADKLVPTSIPELRGRGFIEDIVAGLGKVATVQTNGKKQAAPVGLAPCSAIATGFSHTVLISPSGELWGWGDNSKGQLGLGPNGPPVITEPIKIPLACGADSPDVIFKSVSTGRAHTLCVTRSNCLYAFGSNENGQLGLGQPSVESVPVKVTNLSGKVVAAEAGSDFSVVILLPRAMDGSTVAIQSGEVWVCGNSDSGKLGLSEGNYAPGKDVFELRRIRSLGSSVVQVACGESHACCLTSFGEVYVWGVGANGRLGLGHEKNEYEPALLKLPSGYGNIRQVACGSAHTLALTDKGVLFVWGKSRYVGSLTDLLTPTNYGLQLKATTGVEGAVLKIAAGGKHSGCITKNGKLILWGCNSHWQVAKSGGRVLASDSGGEYLGPCLIREVDAPDCLALGEGTTIVSTRKGELLAWGACSHGRLGIGETDRTKIEPMPITVSWDCSKLSTDGGVKLTRRVENMTDLWKEALEYDEPSVLIIQTTLRQEYRLLDDEALLRFESDLQHIYGKQVDRIASYYDKGIKAERGCDSKLTSVILKLALSLGISPLHYPAVADPTMTLYDPNGVSTPLKDHVQWLRSRITHIQAVVEMLIMQPAYWLIIQPFINTDKLVRTFARLFVLVMNDYDDVFLHTRANAVLEGIGMNEIRHAREQQKLAKKGGDAAFVDINSSLYCRMIQYACYNSSTMLNRICAPIICRSMTETATTADVMASLSAGSSPIEFCWLAESEEAFKAALSSYEVYRPRTAPTVKDILKSQVSLRQLYQDVLMLLVPYMTRLGQSTQLLPPLLDMWTRFLREMGTVKSADPSIDDEQNEWRPFIQFYVKMFMVPVLQNATEFTTRLGYPPLNKRVINNMQFVARALATCTQSGAAKAFELEEGTDLYNSVVLGYQAFEKSICQNILGALMNDTVDITNWTVLASNNVKLIFAFFLSHMEALANPFKHMRIEWYPLLVLINLFRKSEPRLKVLSSFDPLIQAIRGISDSDEPIPAAIISAFEELQENDKSNPFATEVFTYQPGFLFTSRSMTFDRATGVAVPQTLAFRQAVHTRNGVAVSSIVKPYALPDEFDPRTILIKGIAVAGENIEATTWDDLTDAFLSAKEYAVRTQAPTNEIDLLEKCAGLCETANRSYSVKDLILYGVRIVQERAEHRQYLSTLRDVADYFEKLVNKRLSQLEERSLEEAVNQLFAMEVDSTLASVVESTGSQPFIWEALRRFRRRPGDVREFSTDLETLAELKIAEAAPSKNVPVSFQHVNVTSPWEIRIGKYTGIISVDMIPSNCFVPVIIAPGAPALLAGPLRTLLSMIDAIYVAQ